MEGSQGTQTQISTQRKDDPRRFGRNNSGLSEADMSDVFCILHPTSMGAYNIVTQTAQRAPEHVLQNQELVSTDGSPVALEEQETFKLTDVPETSRLGLDLALRLSSETKEPWNGFVFGRNPHFCDIVITVDSVKRVSNRHFRIYLNENGIVMLEDLSTNGTMIDEVHLKAKANKNDATRMLNNGAIIHIASTKYEEYIKFIVRIPPREGFIDQYTNRFEKYWQRYLDALMKAEASGKHLPVTGKRPLLPIAQGNEGDKTAKRPLVGSTSNTHGMHWNGGSVYNVIGQLGKGAFATVYKLATAKDGQLLAAKELEKRKFIKNGRLDQRIDNEMRIMQDLRHPNIVQYINYHDVGNHLYIVMEYIPYGDLQDYLSKNRVLPEYKARPMARQVLEALSYLHQRKITHRDIKPDNILISNMDPFEIKLTDFGLSKVVNNNETFLKTFCGTLLYCAPEVFPHYDNFVAAKGTKRRRGQKSNFHSYSQSVDIWSFAAVLWFALCGEPPFKGVTDATGQGMFNQIMSTKLDPTPLRARIVSDEAIDLLIRMLDTDPSRRPTELECLQHPWLNDGSSVFDHSELGSIQEEIESEKEDDEFEGDDASAGAEEQLSQMSLNGNQQGFDIEEDQEPNPLDSPEFKALVGGRHPSKRFKADRLFPRNQTRDQDLADIDSDSEDLMREAPAAMESQTLPRGQLGQANQAPKLFGEISESALHSSRALGTKTQQALDLRDASTSAEGSDAEQSAFHTSGFFTSAGGSLDGTDSRFRDLDISQIKQAAATESMLQASAYQRATPNTPQLPQTASIGSGQDEETPKAPAKPFSRRLELPVSASSFFDPLDPSTHNLEYASKVSGIDFTGSNKLNMTTQEVASALVQALGHGAAPGEGIASYPVLPQPELNPLTQIPDSTAQNSRTVTQGQFVEENGQVLAQLPDTMNFMTDNPNTQMDLFPSHYLNSQSSEASSQFAKPHPRLGRLQSVDSIANITINLDQPWTSFGRWAICTVQYRPVDDIRIPKKAFEIWFHHLELQQYQKEGKDWTTLDGLCTGITTWSSQGIYVNNTLLTQEDKKGRTQFGHIHSGDIITIFKDLKHKTQLQFKVELFKGEGAKPRPHEFVVQHTV